MANTPGIGSHWGQMVCGWSRVRRVRAGEQVALRVRVVEQQVVVDAEDHAVAGWYTLLCDPALPVGALRGIPQEFEPPAP